MTNILRTRRAIDAAQTTTATAFAAVRTIAPGIADRLDQAATEKAEAEDDLSYVNERLRRLHPPAIFRENVPGQRSIDFDLDVDEIDRGVAIADLEGQRLEVSRRVKAAREQYKAVCLEAANTLLHRAANDWTDREKSMVAARRGVEQTLGRFLGSLLTYGQAVNAERSAARAALAIARQAVTTDEARRALTFAAKTGGVPVAINDDGFAVTVDRPEVGLHGDDTIDFLSVARLLELMFTDPERAAKQLEGTAVGNTISQSKR